jgi:hypothetical protein
MDSLFFSITNPNLASDQTIEKRRKRTEAFHEENESAWNWKGMIWHQEKNRQRHRDSKQSERNPSHSPKRRNRLHQNVMLALELSFIVLNYQCGNELEVNSRSLAIGNWNLMSRLAEKVIGVQYAVQTLPVTANSR